MGPASQDLSSGLFCGEYSRRGGDFLPCDGGQPPLALKEHVAKLSSLSKKVWPTGYGWPGQFNVLPRTTYRNRC